MDIDAAMQRRDWERSVAWYPNGDTVAGVNRFPLRTYGTTSGGPDWQAALLDLGAAAIQSAALPFTYLVVPPFAPQVYTGDVIPPTYTAMPDMRSAQAPPAPDGSVVPNREQELVQLESPEPLPKTAERKPSRDPRRGPLGPGDSDFMSSPPTVEEPD
jgi:hypothetical protein